MNESYKLITNILVQRLSDKAYIPFDPANTDYAQYLAWRAAPCGNCEGRGAIPDTASKGVIQCPVCKGMQRNTPDPADPIPEPVELTPAEKLVSAGLSVDELKELLGIAV